VSVTGTPQGCRDGGGVNCPSTLVHARELAHRAALAVLGYPGTCVPASLALAAFLSEGGASARAQRRQNRPSPPLAERLLPG